MTVEDRAPPHSHLRVWSFVQKEPIGTRAPPRASAATQSRRTGTHMRPKLERKPCARRRVDPRQRNHIARNPHAFQTGQQTIRQGECKGSRHCQVRWRRDVIAPRHRYCAPCIPTGRHRRPPVGKWQHLTNLGGR